MTIPRFDDPMFGGLLGGHTGGLHEFARGLPAPYPTLGASGSFVFSGPSATPGETKSEWFNVTRGPESAWGTYEYLLAGVPIGYSARLEPRQVQFGVGDTAGIGTDLWIHYSADPNWLSALPLLDRWQETQLARDVLRASLHQPYWNAWTQTYGTGESDYGYFSRVADAYNVAGAKSWQEIAFDVWWREDYRNQEGYPTSWIRPNTVWDFRAVVLKRFFDQPGVIAAHGPVNWAYIGGITAPLLKQDYTTALAEFVEKSSRDASVAKAPLNQIAMALAVGGFGAALAGPLIAAALTSTEAVGIGATLLSKGISSAVNMAVQEGIGELQGDPEALTRPASPEIIEALAEQTPQETATMALAVAEREALAQLQEAKQVALSGGDASSIYASAQEQTIVAAELARIAGDDVALSDLQAALTDTMRAIEDPQSYQESLGAPAFTDLGAGVTYSPLAEPATFIDGLSPAALTGSAQIIEPAKASFPWWLLLAVPATMLAGKKGHTRRSRRPSHNRKRIRT